MVTSAPTLSAPSAQEIQLYNSDDFVMLYEQEYQVNFIK